MFNYADRIIQKVKGNFVAANQVKAINKQSQL